MGTAGPDARDAGLILADTSAWVEYLRATGSGADRRLTEVIEAEDERLIVCDVVAMEVLAGASDDTELRQLRDLLGRHPSLPSARREDFEEAAVIFRACARRGRRVRRLTDCLIAAVAIRAGAAVLHRDRDFATIAACTALRIAPA